MNLEIRTAPTSPPPNVGEVALNNGSVVVVRAPSVIPDTGPVGAVGTPLTYNWNEPVTTQAPGHAVLAPFASESHEGRS